MSKVQFKGFETDNKIINKTKTKDDIHDKLKKLISEMTEETKFKFWIKTLLSSYGIFPEIIKTVDKIIELQASTISFTDVYNSKNSTLGQMERVIDLSERKNSLVNIYLMTKDMFNGITNGNLELLEKRYCLGFSIEEISKEYDISTRTTYRRIEKIINEIFNYCKNKNWSLRLIESQIKNEGWIFDRYYKNISDYLKNSNNFSLNEKCQ